MILKGGSRSVEQNAKSKIHMPSPKIENGIDLGLAMLSRIILQDVILWVLQRYHPNFIIYYRRIYAAVESELVHFRIKVISIVIC